jgi:hypothetical protein
MATFQDMQMINPNSRQQSREDELRGESEDRQQAAYRNCQASDTLTEVTECVESMLKHFANLDAMPADYRFDRYSIAGFLMWARRDLERAAKLLGMNQEPAPLPPLTTEELHALPF